MSILGRLFQRDGMSGYWSGIVHFNRGEYDQAIAAFERTLHDIQDPSDPYHNLGCFYATEAHAKIALAGRRKGDLERAATEFRKALSYGHPYPDLHVELAAVLDAQGEHAEAEQKCRAALEIHPGYLAARYRLIIALVEQGHDEEARGELEKLVREGLPVPEGVDPKTTPVDAALCILLRRVLDRSERSHHEFVRAIESYDRGEREQAIAELRSAIQEQPGYADLRCRLGSLLLEAGLVREALKELERAIDINPAYVEARLQAGVAWLRLGEPSQAIAHLSVALERQPDYPDVQLFLGLAYLRDGNLEESSRLLSACIAGAPEFHRARFCLGLVRLVQGRPHEALELMTAAVDADPRLARRRVDLGFLKVRHGEPEVAATLFQQVLGSDPGDLEARVGLGLALESCGRLEAAHGELVKAVDGSPRCQPALGALARIDLQEGRPGEAGLWCDRALKEAPRDVDLLCLRAGAWAGVGDLARAREAFEAALASNPDHVGARVGLGLTLFRLKKKEAGRAEMEAAFLTDPANPIARAFADSRLVEDL